MVLGVFVYKSIGFESPSMKKLDEWVFSPPFCVINVDKIEYFSVLTWLCSGGQHLLAMIVRVLDLRDSAITLVIGSVSSSWKC